MEIRISEAALREVEEAFKVYVDVVDSSDLLKSSGETYTQSVRRFLQWLRCEFTPGEKASKVPKAVLRTNEWSADVVGDLRLVEAIKQHRLMLIDYFPGVRLIEPYGYGLHRNGHEHLVAWQTRGASTSGDGEGWRTFLVDEIEQLEVLDETFDGVRRGYGASSPVKGSTRVYAYYWPRRELSCMNPDITSGSH